MNKNIIFLILCLLVDDSIYGKAEKMHFDVSQKLLNKILADESVLLFQTLNYHWNLTGAEFHDYHLLFDKLYHEQFENTDKIAERVRAVQGNALGSMEQMIKNASINEDSSVPEPKKMVEKLLKQYEKTIDDIKNAIKKLDKEKKDFATINFLEDLLGSHEKTTWMLRSLLNK